VDDGPARLMDAVQSIRDLGIAVDDIGLRRPSLDEVFLALTERSTGP
jgi:ABC-2 type transport system ATP-binding protein